MKSIDFLKFSEEDPNTFHVRTVLCIFNLFRSKTGKEKKEETPVSNNWEILLP